MRAAITLVSLLVIATMVPETQVAEAQGLLKPEKDLFEILGKDVVVARDARAQPTSIRYVPSLWYVNGELRQEDRTERLTWGFAWLINYISTFTTLKPGDLIWTGTPTGAGGHQNPPNWLKPGDVVEVEVPEIGVLRNKVVDES